MIAGLFLEESGKIEGCRLVSLSGKVKAGKWSLRMRGRLGISLGMAGMLAACVVAFPPVEVTRFHLASAITPGKVHIDSDPATSPEALAYVAAVSNAMARQGFPATGLGELAPYTARSAIVRSTSGNMVSIKLTVLLSDARGNTVWDGRAQTTARANSPATQPGLIAQKLADALFAGFPGESGRTVTIP
jgi:hypothetical protein